MSGALSPEATARTFFAEMVAVAGLALYVFSNTSCLPPLTVADMVPSELSLTTTVTLFVASGSFVTPSTDPDSVTVYSYVPGLS